MQAERDAEERANPMKALENRQIESKMEMDILDGLDEIKQKNLLFEEIDADLVLKSKLDEKLKLQRMQEEEEEIYVKSLFEGASDVKILRIKDPIEIEEELLLPKKNTAAVVKPATIDASIIGIKRKVETVVDIPIKKATLLSEIDYDSE